MTLRRAPALLPLLAALFSLYFIWGSTYLVIRIGVESWPPMMLAGHSSVLSRGVICDMAPNFMVRQSRETHWPAARRRKRE